MPTAVETTPRRSRGSPVGEALASGSVRLERRPLVEARTGLPCSTLYEHVAKGLMVPPIRISSRSVAWIASETDAIIRARARGACDTEIRELVAHLVKERNEASATPTEGGRHG
jgi:predicted DNA-binding transcriptional regulator AlpA